MECTNLNLNAGHQSEWRPEAARQSGSFRLQRHGRLLSGRSFERRRQPRGQAHIRTSHRTARSAQKQGKIAVNNDPNIDQTGNRAF